MLKRSLAVAVIAAATFAAPVAAFADDPYPAPDPGLTCSKGQVQLNESFTCTVTGEEGADATLQATFTGGDVTIAGTTTSAPKTITGGEANFTLTAPGVTGPIQIVATVDGTQVTAQAQVEVVDELSSTGFDGMPLAIAAGALLVGGAAVIFVGAARRRSHEREDVNA